MKEMFYISRIDLQYRYSAFLCSCTCAYVG